MALNICGFVKLQSKSGAYIDFVINYCFISSAIMAVQADIVSLDNSVYSTLSTACFPSCNKFATIFKDGLITDSVLLYGFFVA